MKHIINSISAGTEWPMVMWIHRGETSGNSRDLRGLKGHVRTISRDETIQPFRILSLSWKGFPWVQSLLIFTAAWWGRCYYIHIRDKEGLESEFKMSPQPELRRTDSSTLPSLIPDTNWKLCNVDCIHTLTAVDQGSDPWCSASSVTLADLHDRSTVRKGACLCTASHAPCSELNAFCKLSHSHFTLTPSCRHYYKSQLANERNSLK